MKKALFSVVTLSMILLAIFWGVSDVFYLLFPYQPKQVVADNPFMIGGPQLKEANPEDWINSLDEIGMNTVEVSVYAYQGRWNENNLWYYDDEQPVLDKIRLARKAGMKVVLHLGVQLDKPFDQNKFLWHGMIFPRTDYMVQRWFEEYTKFSRKWARIAAEEEVDIMVLGAEMNSIFSTIDTDEIPQLHEYYLNEEKQQRYRDKVMQFKERLSKDNLYAADLDDFDSLANYLDAEQKAKRDWALETAFTDSLDTLGAINLRKAVLNWYWERLIYDLRGIYPGKMTIAANFDNYQEVRFWDKLDFIGINAYFPLRKLGEKASQQVLQSQWDKALDDALKYRKVMEIPNHPFLFTGFGYARHDGSTYSPRQATGYSILEQEEGGDSLFVWKEQKTDLSERNAAVRALYHSVKRRRFPLAGILYWKLTDQANQLPDDPFALQIGLDSRDTLQGLLVQFKRLESIIKREMILQERSQDSLSTQ